MRIGILVLMAGRNAGGPETYEVGLIQALAAIDSRNEYIVYCTTASAIDAIGVRQANFQYRLLKPGLRLISLSVSLPAAILRDKIDLLHATFTPPPFTPVPLIFTMHCMSNFTHPEFYPKLVAWRLNRLERVGIRKARRILCVSDTLRTEVHEAFGTPLDRMSVTYNGVGPAFRPMAPEEAAPVLKERLGIDFPYVLFVGKLQARKNLGRTIQAFARFRERTGSKAKLLLAGRRTATSETIDQAIRELGIGEHVVELGYLPHASSQQDSLLPYLYSGARMFLFVSLWEGFGLPLVEAMASGTPAITSNVTCLPEIAGDAALIVAPESVEEITEAMVRIETSPELRASLARKGPVRARRFDWHECARGTLEAYREVAAQGASVAASR